MVENGGYNWNWGRGGGRGRGGWGYRGKPSMIIFVSCIAILHDFKVLPMHFDKFG